MTQAALAVQVSAYPNAYAKWEPDATTLVVAAGSQAGLDMGGFGMCSGWVAPVDAPIVPGFAPAPGPATTASTSAPHAGPRSAPRRPAR
ncbi:hypothetical protein [Catellatospora methionotrophica]|uniref:hypothetical protein n=1 Tax=Catellatospora methionotrophica TaxID=121620 RepID=UPI0033CC2A03